MKKKIVCSYGSDAFLGNNPWPMEERLEDAKHYADILSPLLGQYDADFHLIAEYDLKDIDIIYKKYDGIIYLETENERRYRCTLKHGVTEGMMEEVNAGIRLNMGMISLVVPPGNIVTALYKYEVSSSNPAYGSLHSTGKELKGPLIFRKYGDTEEDTKGARLILGSGSGSVFVVKYNGALADVLYKSSVSGYKRSGLLLRP